MTTSQKIAVAFLGACAVLGAFAFFGLTPYGKTLVQQFGASPAGTTFNTAKVAAININPQSKTSTSTSLYNGDASDRIVTDGFVSCSGLTSMKGATSAGVAKFNWTAATSSTAAPAPSIAARKFAALQVTLGTSTAYNEIATSTFTVPWGHLWKAGTYMIFQTNATSSAAACQVGVHYLGQ
jgi:hypothetical protein